jgi:hypothetical protein
MWPAQQYRPCDAERYETEHDSLTLQFPHDAFSCGSFLNRAVFPAVLTEPNRSLGLLNSASPVVLIDQIQQKQITRPLPSQSEGRKPLFLGQIPTNHHPRFVTKTPFAAPGSLRESLAYPTEHDRPVTLKSQKKRKKRLERFGLCRCSPDDTADVPPHDG